MTNKIRRFEEAEVTALPVKIIVPTDTMVQCPKCEMRYLITAKICPECGMKNEEVEK